VVNLVAARGPAALDQPNGRSMGAERTLDR